MYKRQGHDGGPLPENGVAIKKGKLRGIESNGMLCSIEELGSSKEMYPNAPESGIYILPADTEEGADAVSYTHLDLYDGGRSGMCRTCHTKILDCIFGGICDCKGGLLCESGVLRFHASGYHNAGTSGCGFLSWFCMGVYLSLIHI